MIVPPTDQRLIGNRLLAALPEESYQRLLPHLQPVPLRLSEILCEAGEPLPWGWFVTRGVASMLSTTPGGNTVEVGMVGNEGLIGLPILLKGNHLPYRVMVQLAGEALRVPMDVLQREFSRCGSLHDLLLRYTCAQVVQFTQSGVCNRFHTIEERLCRWLLILHDQAEHDTISLTQELTASMLGVRRTGVSLVAGRLQSAGLIRYRRGRITILNREGLEASACECYSVIRNEFDQLFRPEKFQVDGHNV
ncbi:MAG TPA: Crp/Fnr family transcriptional regulator [Blastocatellia bacterium]|nr:Crp/Fnr family transcriptional regulator [Blastocatellia bacterium]